MADKQIWEWFTGGGKKMCCATCKWWVLFDGSPGVIGTGQCRAVPPGQGKGPSHTGVPWHGSEWVHTNANDFCAFHQYNEIGGTSTFDRLTEIKS